jgi:hypothetical protein
MPDAPSKKICGICGQDCSSRPRIKDQQGRYFCKACAEQQAAQRRAAAPPPSPPPATDEDALPASFWTDNPAQATTPCPSCGAPMSQGAVLCLSCGHNTQSGRRAKAKVAKVKVERSGPRISLSPGLVAGILILVFGAGFPLAIGGEAPAIAYYLGACVLSLVAWITMIVCAFKDGHTGWGITGIVSLVIPCVGLAMLYYLIAISERPMVKTLVAMSIIVTVAALVALQIAGVDLREFTSS